MSALEQLRQEVVAAARTVAGDAPVERLTLERPRRAQFGDVSTNVAMLLAPALGEQPRAVAERVGEALRDRLGEHLERVEVAGPGFLNLFLADAWYVGALDAVLAAGAAYGGAGAAAAERVDVEFVSANPTGPLHVGHARNAAYGDALCRILAFHGHDVDREYYVNDGGSQVANLARSVRARARGEDVPEDGYQGGYVAELAEQLGGAADADLDELGRRAIEHMLERIRATLERFRVTFDVWTSERSLYAGEPTAVQQAFAELERQGHVYRSEGALWLRTTAFGDDKDRVLERSSGEHTYFASDVAYHEHKRARGYDRLFDVLGADHHGYVQRVKAAFGALGGDRDRLEMLLMQLVHLVSRGERASMSKRAGDFVTLDDLVGEVGVDAARWFLLQRSHDSAVEFDLDLARQESADNPVYYVQYAHARIASLRAKAGAAEPHGEAAAVALEPAERALIQRLLAFPAEVAEAAERRAPHRVCAYALELAQDFTAFYRDCQVVGAQPGELERFRLALSVATQRTIARSLDLLGIEAPDSM